MEGYKIKRENSFDLDDPTVEVLDIADKLNKHELIANVDENFIRNYYNIIKIQRNYDFFLEEDIIKFKDKINNSFRSNLLFPQKDRNTIKMLYFDKLEQCQNKNSL